MFQNLKLQGFSSNPLILRTLCSKGIAIEPVWTRSRQKNSNNQIGCWILLWSVFFLVSFQPYFTNIVFWVTRELPTMSGYMPGLVTRALFLLTLSSRFDFFWWHDRHMMPRPNPPEWAFSPDPNVQTQLRTLVITTFFIPRPKSHSYDDLGLFTALRSSGSRRHRPAD